MAGVGNWYTAQYWEYGTREVQHKNPDPVKNPSVSPYAVFGGNPILKNDPLGNTPNSYDVNGNTGEKKYVDNKGGDQTDYVHLHYDGPTNVPETTAKKPVFLPPGLRGKPAGDYEIPVQTYKLPGTGAYPYTAYRGIGVKVMGSLVEGATPVDDPFTSIGPGLIYGLGRRAAIGLAAREGENILYHYTSREAAENIMRTGLTVTERRPFVYTTNVGNLSPLQANIELALPSNRALPNTVLRINTTGLSPTMIRRVTGNLPGYGAGGGTEILFNQSIPAARISIMP